MAAPEYKGYDLHPYGWEKDPAEERFALSIFDKLQVQTFNHYLLFFPLDDDTAETREKVTAALKEGLERTLAQCRHACGQIDQDESGEFVIVKKKDSTVPFGVRTHASPSLKEVQAAHYSSKSVGELSDFACLPLWGLKVQAKPESKPKMAGFQANFVPGGLILNMQNHHYANDVMGWFNFVLQLADNCAAVVNKTEFPAWDPLNIDVSHFNKEVPEAERVDAPPPPPRHAEHVEQVCLLFRLSEAKGRLLKAKATPQGDEAKTTAWVSTYDAAVALLWRAVVRQRMGLFKLDASAPVYLGEAVNMRTRIKSAEILGHAVPSRMQRNMTGIVDNASVGAALPLNATAGQVAADEADYGLSKVAAQIRHMTDYANEGFLKAVMDKVAPVRDKTKLGLTLESFPPGPYFITDHRPAAVSEVDFGFGRPLTARHPFKTLPLGFAVTYKAPRGEDGMVVQAVVEKQLMAGILADKDLAEYFDFLCVDADDDMAWKA